MTVALAVLAWPVAVSVALVAGWWLILSLAALPAPRARIRRPRGPIAIVAVVPAHNEERHVARCVRSLLAAQQAGDSRPDVVVVADNCTDATAALAAAAGATVLARTDAAVRGKSHALAFALGALRQRPSPPDGVVFVDADSVVSRDFFVASGARLREGARAVQAHYRPLPSHEPLVRLRALAFRLVHWSRPLGASRLRLGSGFKGNGMLVAWEVARDWPGGSGLAEDAAMTLAFATRNLPVRFEPRATVWGEMAGGYAVASVQDRRWEAGRFALLPRALGVGLAALFRGRLSAAAGAFEVASPPLSLLSLLAALPPAAALAGAIPWWAAAAPMALVGASFVAGLAAARPPARELSALREVPRFFAHKVAVYAGLALHQAPTTWERTSRQ
ncbi:MAG: glycosyltransferase [Dehalococcoidia bacterium]|nr:glycosyltransferase [Dehalococcoidia bacterium]